MKSWIGWILMGILTAACVTISWVQRPSEARDRAEIEALVQEYYGALRARDFERAASFYVPAVGTIISATGNRLPDVLKSATELSADGIPPVVRLEALRFDEQKPGRAVAELVIPGPRTPGIGNYRMKDKKTGADEGTWARTLHFTRVGREWKISEESSSSVDVKTGKLLKLLQAASRR